MHDPNDGWLLALALRPLDRHLGLLLMLVVVHGRSPKKRAGPPPIACDDPGSRKRPRICASAAPAGITKNWVLKSPRCSSYRTPLSENGVRKITGVRSDPPYPLKNDPSAGLECARAAISHRTPNSGRHSVSEESSPAVFSSGGRRLARHSSVTAPASFDGSPAAAGYASRAIAPAEGDAYPRA